MLTVNDFECLPIHFAFSKINVVFVYTRQFKREIEGEESVCLCLHCIDKFDEPMMCTENNTAQHSTTNVFYSIHFSEMLDGVTCVRARAHSNKHKSTLNTRFKHFTHLELLINKCKYLR